MSAVSPVLLMNLNAVWHGANPPASTICESEADVQVYLISKVAALDSAVQGLQLAPLTATKKPAEHAVTTLSFAVVHVTVVALEGELHTLQVASEGGFAAELPAVK